MDFIFWLILGLGLLLALLSLVGLALAFFVERGKTEAERSNADAEYQEPFLGTLAGGLVLIGFALFLWNAETWFPIFLTMLAIVAATGCVMVLRSDIAAASEAKPAEEKVALRRASQRWARRGTWAAQAALVLCFFYWINHVNTKLDDLTSRLKTLEGKEAVATRTAK